LPHISVVNNMMKTFFILSLLLLLVSSAFISPAQKRVRGVVVTNSDSCLYAAAPKKAAKKKKTKTKTKTNTVAPTVQVETFRKPDFVASVQQKTGLSKTDSEAALMAVLDTISEVRLL